jgi:hypothetical protein
MTTTKQALRDLLRTAPLDKEEVDALVEHRRCERDIAKLACRLENVDKVDLAQILAPLIARKNTPKNKARRSVLRADPEGGRLGGRPDDADAFTGRSRRAGRVEGAGL